jgi:ATP-dependent Lhr-like helicase
VTDAAVRRLHPAVVHHLVNTLGWRSLRPLQERAVAPLLDGSHTLLAAPTAGGKTEAALLPLLSRMVAERWGGLSVLYVCPLRALLNNLHPRIAGHCELLGRRAALWHGDVGNGERRRILGDPPDVLLTTPESLEAMFLSTRVDADALLGAVRAVVIDEIHAFAGDDRGWHLVALLARLAVLARAPVQRVGLTATVGNPGELLDWLCTGAAGERAVVAAEADDLVVPELTVDWVGTVDNAARVIAALHRGEKRLAFADSRARVEELAAALRGRGVTTFVSHSSLSADERRQAERAFVESRDCVIVATSTLELGLDVGDLDRVVQLGAPRTVASVLQRMGRTGRRAGTVRNCLFLATTDEELLQALALVRLIGDGWVEPLRPPAFPVHLAAQQLLARVLSEGRVGRGAWPADFAAVSAAAGLGGVLDAVVEHMVARGVLIDLEGVLQIGEEGERLYGRRHFMDVTSLFLTAPLMTVRWGARTLGQVDPSSLTSRDGQRPVILLGGAAWGVREIDWGRRVAWVEPVEERGRSRWGGAGGALSLELCRAMRSVLGDSGLPESASRRAASRLEEIRETFWFVREGATALVPDRERRRSRWWTFAGARANGEIGARLQARELRVASSDDLGVTVLGSPNSSALHDALTAGEVTTEVDIRRLEAVKFSEAVPVRLLQILVERRDADPAGVRAVQGEPVETVSDRS